MTHPFFDSLNYPIHRDDATVLLTTLCEKYSDVLTVARIFRECEGRSGTFQTGQPDLSLTWLAVLDQLSGQVLLKRIGG